MYVCHRVTTNSPSQLFGTLMILKAACMNNPSYIDRLITSFMRVLQRMAREHLTPTTPDLGNVASELLILSLDLVKNRVGAMTPDMRKMFIGSVLVGLIDKTQDAKVMKAIMKMVEDWVKTKVCSGSSIVGYLRVDLPRRLIYPILYNFTLIFFQHIQHE